LRLYTKLLIVLQSMNRDIIHSGVKAICEKFNDFAQHGSKRALWVNEKWDWKRAEKF